MNFQDIIDRIDDVLNSDVHYDDSIDYVLTTDDAEWLEAARAILQHYGRMETNIKHSMQLIKEICDDSEV